MSGEENMDFIARKLLLDEEMDPSPAVWNAIEGRLDNNRKGGWLFLPYQLLIGALGMLLIGFIAWGVWNVSSPAAKISKSETGKLKDTSLIELEKSREDVSTSALDKGNADAGANAKSEKEGLDQPIHSRDNNSPTLQSENIQTAFVSNESVRKSEKTGTVSKSMGNQPTAPVSGKIAGLASGSSTNSNVEAHTDAIHSSIAPFKEPTALSPNPDRSDLLKMPALMPIVEVSIPSLAETEFLKYQPLPNRNWILGAFADMRATSLQLNAGTENGTALIDSLSRAENASLNFGFGLSIGREIGDRWRITSGVSYTNWCRNTSYPISFDIPENFEGSLATAGEFIALSATNISATGIQNIEVLTPQLLVANEQIDGMLNGSVNNEIEVQECYELIQIPLLLEYQFNFGRYRLLPGAGLAYDRVLSRSTTLIAQADDFRSTISSLENTRKNFFSYQAALHAEYVLTEQWSLRAGATYQAWITPIYESDAIKTYPRLWSIKAGIIYEF